MEGRGLDTALHKLARQLMAYDEASLMAMWERYAAVVERFEPTRRWEEAVIVLGMIQAMRWKNQLFNHHWKEMNQPCDEPVRPSLVNVPSPAAEPSGPGGDAGDDKRAKVLRFRPREGDEPV
jgi:hypothetical protein